MKRALHRTMTLVLASVALPLLAASRSRGLDLESYDWVAGEVLPGEPNWSPRRAPLRDAARA